MLTAWHVTLHASWRCFSWRVRFWSVAVFKSVAFGRKWDEEKAFCGTADMNVYSWRVWRVQCEAVRWMNRTGRWAEEMKQVSNLWWRRCRKLAPCFCRRCRKPGARFPSRGSGWTRPRGRSRISLSSEIPPFPPGLASPSWSSGCHPAAPRSRTTRHGDTKKHRINASYSPHTHRHAGSWSKA